LASIPDGLIGKGSFLSAADFYAIPEAQRGKKSTLRPYGRRRDTARKLWSGKRAVAATILTILTALVAFWFVFAGQSAESPASVASKGQTLLRWADAPSGSAQRAVRTRLATSCLDRSRGGFVPTPNRRASVAGVPCVTHPIPWFRNKDNSPFIVAALGLLAATLPAIGLWSMTAFGKKLT